MTKTKNRRGGRVLALALLILTIITLVFSLTACGQDETVPPVRARGYEESDVSYVAAVLKTNEIYKMRFIAAARGYDITYDSATGAYTSDKTQAEGGVDVEAGKKVLDDVIKNLSFTNSSDKEGMESFKNSLTAEKMQEVIKHDNIRESVNLIAEGGFFKAIIRGIGKFLKVLNKAFGSYAVALIFFALIVEVLMLPFAIKQQKNMIGMAKLKPALMKIEKKYAGRTDTVTLQKKRNEMLELQQKEGFSPFSGCLPLILQLIIVGFILYPLIQNPMFYMLNQSDQFSSALVYYATAPTEAGGMGMTLSGNGNVVELFHVFINEPTRLEGIAEFAPIKNGAEILARYKSLEIPNFSVFGKNLGAIPSFKSILVLVPILNIIAQWGTMFLTKRWNKGANQNPAMADGQTQASMRIMEFLPLVLTAWILFKIPAMIGVYWLIRSLISLGKQYVIKLALPIPQYTAEELKEMEKLEKEKQKAQKAALKSQPKYRSLHYIDEDDYEELPEIKPQNGDKPRSSGDAPEIKD